MHVQGEVGDLKRGCSGRWEVKYLWDVQWGGEGVFSMSSMQCVLIFSGMINHLV